MYNNPYFYNNYFPYQNFDPNRLAKRGIFSSLFSGLGRFNWDNFLNNTQKTLNVINQASSAYYQVKPIYNNAKTMFRMVHALKDDDNTQTVSNTKKEEKKNTNNNPVFFL